jgi:hypothetical protein
LEGVAGPNTSIMIVIEKAGKFRLSSEGWSVFEKAVNAKKAPMFKDELLELGEAPGEGQKLKPKEGQK